MGMRHVKFSELPDEALLISPIDNLVSKFWRDQDGCEYICSNEAAFDICNFDEEDFYVYTGSKEVDDADPEFFSDKELLAYEAV